MARKLDKINISYSLKLFVKYNFENGIGKSKRAIQKQNGGNTPFIHSFSTLNRYSGLVKAFGLFVKEHFNVNRIDKLKLEHLQSYIDYKLSLNLAESTLKINLDALKKYFEFLNTTKLLDTTQFVSYINNNFQTIWSQGRAGREGEPIPPYKIDDLLNKLSEKSNLFRSFAMIQNLTGGRVGDVKKIKLDEANYKVIITKSKGGKTREIDYTDRKEQFEKIKEHHNVIKDVYQNPRQYDFANAREFRTKYNIAFRNSAKSVLGESFTPHSLRYDYAGERAKQVNYDDTIITKELGHERARMSRKYYKNYA